VTSVEHGYRGEFGDSAFQYGALLPASRERAFGQARASRGPRCGALEEAILRTAYAFRATHGLRAGSRVAIRLRNRTS
jgi:hypothetical protein